MSDFLSDSSFFPIMLTIGAFAAGSLLQKKFKSPLLNPILLGALIVMAVLLIFRIPNETYQEACRPLSFLLTPATICLAIAFYEQLIELKDQLPVILAGVITGTFCSLACILILGKLFGLEQTLITSLLPKSVTTAIGVSLSEEAGGIPAVTTAAIICTGILGNMAGPFLCRIFSVKDPVAQGVSYGTASHVIGTVRASEQSPVSGAVSTFSLTLAGLLTAVCFSFIV